MWTRTFSTTTNEITKEQIWKLFADVNHWHTWDEGTEYAIISGKFEQGNFFVLKPKGGPEVKVTLIKTIENRMFLDLTQFPLAKMYDEHLFEDTPEGLKITNTITVKGVLGFLWVRLVAKNIVHSWPEDVANQIRSAKKL
ncbi:polyketide cyclase [uncultured Chryseobacterium sp.]|uniref:polyketide cyclase n=1 Tax=uncultured Chryseobacterium sp. TaxID=259322 RepID=UPI0025D3AF33|nr:polyketide cyclase [uncultured Chryseobacterium sp.]